MTILDTFIACAKSVSNGLYYLAVALREFPANQDRQGAIAVNLHDEAIIEQDIERFLRVLVQHIPEQDALLRLQENAIACLQSEERARPRAG